MKPLVLAGCALGLLLSSASANAPATPAAPPITSDPHSAAAALARATRLAEGLQLPPGMVWTTKPTVRHDAGEASQTVVVIRRAYGAHPSATLGKYFRSHTLPGLTVTDAVEFLPHQVNVDYGTKARTYTSADLDYTRAGTAVSAELDVSVGWAPAKTADMVVPTTTRAATIEVWPATITYGPGPVPSYAHQVDRVSGPGVGQLARYLDGLPVQGPVVFGSGACTEPMFYGSSPRITFRTDGHVVIFQYVEECQQFTVSVDGHHRPTLSPSWSNEPTTLVMKTLLHLVP